MSELKFYEHSQTKNPKYLVIFLHGYGANGENLIDLAYQFESILPEAHFISPNAVEPWEGGFPDAYQWFSLSAGTTRKALPEIASDIKKANKILAQFIDEQLKRFNLKKENLFIMGFSQGSMMAIYQGLIASEKPAAVISFSGKVILPEMIGEKTISKPQICLIHGELDSVLVFDNFLESQKILTQEKIPFESLAIANLDHSIDMNGINFAKNFIKKILA
jgi:phospholipase/carboxylesterase